MIKEVIIVEFEYMKIAERQQRSSSLPVCLLSWIPIVSRSCCSPRTHTASSGPCCREDHIRATRVCQATDSLTYASPNLIVRCRGSRASHRRHPQRRGIPRCNSCPSVFHLQRSFRSSRSDRALIVYDRAATSWDRSRATPESPQSSRAVLSATDFIARRPKRSF